MTRKALSKLTGIDFASSLNIGISPAVKGNLSSPIKSETVDINGTKYNEKSEVKTLNAADSTIFTNIISYTKVQGDKNDTSANSTTEAASPITMAAANSTTEAASPTTIAAPNSTTEAASATTSAPVTTTQVGSQ